MMLPVIGGIHIDEPFRIFEYIFPIPVPGHPEYFIDQPHMGRAVQIKDLPELCKGTHEQLLYKVL